MGKGHYFTVPYFTKAYGNTGDRLLFVNAVDFSAPSAQRQETIVPNTDIPTLVKSERICSITVESTNADQSLRLTFTGNLTVHEDHSISYDEIEHRVTLINNQSEDTTVRNPNQEKE